MKVWILGFLTVAACGQAVDQPPPTVEVAPAPDVKANNEIVSAARADIAVEANPEAAARMPELVAVPEGREVSDDEARAYGPPSDMWKRELKAGAVAIEHAVEKEEVKP